MKLIATICTIPARKETFKKVLRRLLNEQTHPVDGIHVWLNGYSEIPGDFQVDKRVVYHLEPSNPGPWVRYNLDQYMSGDEIVATVDDDLLYPGDYFEKGVRDLIGFHENTSISYGGLYWDDVVPIGSVDYYAHRRLISITKKSWTRKITVLIGCCGFHRSANIKNIINTNLPYVSTNDDLMVSYNLQKKGVGIRSAAKDSGWLKEYPASTAENALWRRDRSNRSKAFGLLVRKHGFIPYIVGETEQKNIRLLISDGPVSDEGIEEIYKTCSSVPGLHTLEIIEGPLGAYTSRLIRRHHEHFVSIKDTVGRFDHLKPVDLIRRIRNCVECSPDIIKYIKWIDDKHGISDWEIKYSSGQKWAYHAANIYCKYFLKAR